MSGLKESTNELLFNGLTMKVAIDKGYTLSDVALVSKLHTSLIRKYHSLSKVEREMLRNKAQEYINERINNLSKPSNNVISEQTND